MPSDWYSILEVEPKASANEIRAAYRRQVSGSMWRKADLQALRSHPDRAPPTEKDEATARFKMVAEYVLHGDDTDTGRMKC